MTSYPIEVQDLKYTYDGRKYAVDSISFSVKEGEVFGMLGRNGAGKTTTIRILSTLLKRSSGSVEVLGMDPSTAGNHIRKRIGVVLQDESFDFTTVEKALDVYGFIWGVSKSERDKKRESLLNTFELTDVRKKRMWDLSGGQKRRVQVAREFMHDMDLLFLDEPTSGLDPIARRNILNMIKDLTKDGLSVLFTTHNLEEADYLCQRVAIMNNGKILASDTIDALKTGYNGLKTVEVKIGGGQAGAESMFSKVSSGRVEPPFESGLPYRIVTENTQETMQEIIKLAVAESVQIEWLNVRAVSLEDVFISTIVGGSE
ncbi:MAG: ABC transporter ATP-binding protein [Thermoplasmata archaeon]